MAGCLGLTCVSESTLFCFGIICICFFSFSLLDWRLSEGNTLKKLKNILSEIVGSQLTFVEWQFICTTLVVRFEVSEFFYEGKVDLDVDF